jgi:hypothetical protein
LNATQFLSAALLALILGTAGCSGGAATVTGEVTYDGTSVQSGAVTFIPVGNDKAKKVGGQIVDGKYTIEPTAELAPGSYKVEIHWRKPTGKKYKSDSGEYDVTEEGLPAKYHDKTTLTAEVKSGVNVIDFKLAK